MDEPLTPWDTIRVLIDSLSFSNLIWILVAIGLVFLFQSIAIRRSKKAEATWARVMFWLIALVGWAFIMFMVTWAKIVTGGLFAILLLVLSAMAFSITIWRLTKRTRIWEKIVSGAVIAVIGYGVLASFGCGNAPAGYGLVMGLVLGIILGLISSTVRVLRGGLETEVDDQIESDREQEPAPPRRVKGI